VGAIVEALCDRKKRGSKGKLEPWGSARPTGPLGHATPSSLNASINGHRVLAKVPQFASVERRGSKIKNGGLPNLREGRVEEKGGVHHWTTDTRRGLVLSKGVGKARDGEKENRSVRRIILQQGGEVESQIRITERSTEADSMGAWRGQ